jgi:hypothetical protein
MSEEKNSQSLPGAEPPIVESVTQRYTTGLSGSSFLLLKCFETTKNISNKMRSIFSSFVNLNIWVDRGIFCQGAAAIKIRDFATAQS